MYLQYVKSKQSRKENLCSIGILEATWQKDPDPDTHS